MPYLQPNLLRTVENKGASKIMKFDSHNIFACFNILDLFISTPFMANTAKAQATSAADR